MGIRMASSVPLDDAGLLRLLQVTSPALPVGAFAWSQGLEYAVHVGWVNDESSALNWIGGLLSHSLSMLDLPCLTRLYRSWQTEDNELAVKHWNAFLLANRESRELRAEDTQLGGALMRLLADLDVPQAKSWTGPTAFANAFSLAGVAWRIPLRETLLGYLWSWTENQVAAAIKLVPLGQTAGQRLLSQLQRQMPTSVARGLDCRDGEIGQLAVGLALASAQHETQRVRLFRS